MTTGLGGGPARRECVIGASQILEPKKHGTLRCDPVSRSCPAGSWLHGYRPRPSATSSTPPTRAGPRHRWPGHRQDRRPAARTCSPNAEMATCSSPPSPQHCPRLCVAGNHASSASGRRSASRTGDGQSRPPQPWRVRRPAFRDGTKPRPHRRSPRRRRVRPGRPSCRRRGSIGRLRRREHPPRRARVTPWQAVISIDLSRTLNRVRLFGAACSIVIRICITNPTMRSLSPALREMSGGAIRACQRRIPVRQLSMAA